MKKQNKTTTPPKMKAYKIITKYHRDGDYGIYSAPTAGAAKTQCYYSARNAFPDFSYADIVSCVRVPELDSAASDNPDKCIGWKNGEIKATFDKSLNLNLI